MEYVIDRLWLRRDKSQCSFAPHDLDNDGDAGPDCVHGPDYGRQMRRKSYCARFPESGGSPYIDSTTCKQVNWL